MAFTTLTLGLTLTLPTNGTKSWGTTLKNTTWTKISGHDHSGSGNGLQLGTSAITDYSITSSKLSKNLALFLATSALNPSGTTQTIDWNLGNDQTLGLASASGNVTLSFSNSLLGARYRIQIYQGATPRTLVWPASILWPGGQAPILSTANGAVDIVELFYDGTNFFGTWEVAFS